MSICGSLVSDISSEVARLMGWNLGLLVDDRQNIIKTDYNPEILETQAGFDQIGKINTRSLLKNPEIQPMDG